MTTRDSYLLVAARKAAASLPELTPQKLEEVRALLYGPTGRVEHAVLPALPPMPAETPRAERKSRPAPRPTPPVLAGVYFVRSGNLIKIGTSTNVNARLAALRTMSALPLELMAVAEGGYTEEGAVHQRFASLRQHGEWFTAAPELLAFVAEIAEHRARLAETKETP